MPLSASSQSAPIPSILSPVRWIGYINFPCFPGIRHASPSARKKKVLTRPFRSPKRRSRGQKGRRTAGRAGSAKSAGRRRIGQSAAVRGIDHHRPGRDRSQGGHRVGQPGRCRDAGNPRRWPAACRERNCVYYAVNKPVGVVCTNSDPSGRPAGDRHVAVGRRSAVHHRPIGLEQRRLDPRDERRRVGQSAHASALRRGENLSRAGRRAARRPRFL